MPNPCAPASALTRIATLLSSLITSLVFQAFRGAKRRGERVSMMVSGNEFHAANKRASTRMEPSCILGFAALCLSPS